MTAYPRNSRRAVHAIAQALSDDKHDTWTYACGVTDKHVQSRSGGGTSEHNRVTCEACVAKLAEVSS